MSEKKFYAKKTESKDFNNINPKNERPLIKEAKMETTKNLVKYNVGNGNGALEMKIKDVPVNSLIVKYHPRNTLGDIESLQGSIKRDGLQEPLLVYEVDENQYAVIDGVRRLAAIQEFGWQSVPCLIRKGMDASGAAHLSYVKNTERNSLNAIEIALHLKAMTDEFGYTHRELELKGYGSPAKISGQLKLLDLPESIQKKIQEGELTAAHGRELVKLPTKKEQEKMAKQVKDFDWTAKRANIRIKRYLAKGKKKVEKDKEQTPSSDVPGVYFKDSRDMSELPDGIVHLILTSPPYGIGKEFELGMTLNELLDMMRGVLKECSRVLTPGGIIALNIGDIHNFKGEAGKNDYNQIELMGHYYQRFLRSHRVYLTDHIIWQKPIAWANRESYSYTDKTKHTSYKIADNFEHVYLFRKKGERELPSEDVILKSRITKQQWAGWVQGVWKIQTVHKMEKHPCEWPEELPSRLIKMFSYEGDTVLDPFLGSGTTVKVARELNRDGIGYEKELQYKPVIMEKLGVIPEKAVDEGSETMAEFFKRVMDSESSKPFVETIPVNTGKTFKGVESAEEFSEASMAV